MQKAVIIEMTSELVTYVSLTSATYAHESDRVSRFVLSEYHLRQGLLVRGLHSHQPATHELCLPIELHKYFMVQIPIFQAHS